MKTNSTAPEIRCPKCKHTWSTNVDFELQVGSEVQCQGCGEIIQFVDEEVTRHWSWEVVKQEKKVG
jgi:DNA-directed RNA polymerase subunit RPC12/RpoP